MRADITRHHKHTRGVESGLRRLTLKNENDVGRKQEEMDNTLENVGRPLVKVTTLTIRVRGKRTSPEFCSRDRGPCR
jgi:hypothetical protein